MIHRATFFAVLLVAGCGADAPPAPDSPGSVAPASYPETGTFGANILAPAVTAATAAEAYSFRVELPESGSLEVVLTLLTTLPEPNVFPNNVWGFHQDRNHTWATSIFDYATGVQRFVTTPVDRFEVGVSDLSMAFHGTGSVRFDYYEHGVQIPSLTKTVDWQ